MKLKVNHVTHYRYSATVSHSVNQLCLIPRNTQYQSCLSSKIIIDPKPTRIEKRFDGFGNNVAHFNLEKNHTECVIESISLIETTDIPPDLPSTCTLQELNALLESDYSSNGILAKKCLLPSPNVSSIDGVQDLIDELKSAKLDVLGFSEQLMRWIFQEFEYDPSFSTVVTPAQIAWDAKRGVCQDFAHVAIAILREVGIPARYVSGYLETLPPPGQQKLQGSDASHAWFAVYAPQYGWFDFDPTNNKRTDGQYVVTAWGRDYADVAPLKGIVYGGNDHTVSIAVDVNRVNGALYAVSDAE